MTAELGVHGVCKRCENRIRPAGFSLRGAGTLTTFEGKVPVVVGFKATMRRRRCRCCRREGGSNVNERVDTQPEKRARHLHDKFVMNPAPQRVLMNPLWRKEGRARIEPGPGCKAGFPALFELRLVLSSPPVDPVDRLGRWDATVPYRCRLACQPGPPGTCPQAAFPRSSQGESRPIQAI